MFEACYMLSNILFFNIDTCIEITSCFNLMIIINYYAYVVFFKAFFSKIN
jgi:hypothetical protein